jgi:Ribosomal protein S17E
MRRPRSPSKKHAGGNIVGSIRQTYIKSTVDALLRQYPNEFGTDFNENKDKVERLANVQTKEVRNRLAGYVTRKMSSRGRKR